MEDPKPTRTHDGLPREKARSRQPLSFMVRLTGQKTRANGWDRSPQPPTRKILCLLSLSGASVI